MEKQMMIGRRKEDEKPSGPDLVHDRNQSWVLPRNLHKVADGGINDLPSGRHAALGG